MTSQVTANGVLVQCNGAQVYVNYVDIERSVTQVTANGVLVQCNGAQVYVNYVDIERSVTEAVAATDSPIARVISAQYVVDAVAAGSSVAGVGVYYGTLPEGVTAMATTSVAATLQGNRQDATEAATTISSISTFVASSMAVGIATDEALSSREIYASGLSLAYPLDTYSVLRSLFGVRSEEVVATERVYLSEAHYPYPAQVAQGVSYGPNGGDFVGTAIIPTGLLYDVATGNLVKPIDAKRVMTL